MPMLATKTITGAQSTDESVLFSMVREQMNLLPSYLANAKANNTVIGAVESQTTVCPNGGSLTTSTKDADNDGVVSAGDSVTLLSSNCGIGGSTLAGTLSFVVNSSSGTFNSLNYSAGMTINFGNFSVVSSQLSATANGSMNFSITTSGADAISVRLATPLLSVSGTYAGVARSRTLTNYSAAFTRTPDASDNYLTSYTIEGWMTSTSLSSQAIYFTTPTPLVARNSDTYPSSGVMIITGASNSKLRLTATSNSRVHLELDVNGDGTYEHAGNVNWNALM
jgi:hypothetical protein